MALNKPAYQRSTYTEESKDWSAHNAVDGIIYDGADDDIKYTHSLNGGPGPQWWIVDLKDQFTITEIYVYTRLKKCMFMFTY